MDLNSNAVAPTKRPHSDASQLELDITDTPTTLPVANAAISPPSYLIAQLPTAAASMNPEAKRSRFASSPRSLSDSASIISTSQSGMERNSSPPAGRVQKPTSNDAVCRDDQEMKTAPEAERSFKDLLEVKEKLLQRCLVVTDNLLLKLKRIVGQDDKNAIQCQPTPDAKITKLLQVLDDVPDDRESEVFNKFLSALRDDGQEHVANIFRRESDVLPMSDEHYEILKRETTRICQCLDPQEDLMDKLINEKVFSDSDRNRVMVKTDRDARAREAIDVLIHKYDSAFDKLITGLRSTNRQHVVSLLGEKSDRIPLSEEHRQLLVNKTGEIAEFLDTKCGLLDHLVTVGVLTTVDRSSVRGRESMDEMARELMDILPRKSDCAFEKFVHALRRTDQDHVVYILTGEGATRPLSLHCRQIIRSTRDELVSCIDAECTTLIDKLISGNVLNTSDEQRLQQQPTNQAKNGVILDALVRKSQQAFGKFVLALRDVGQKQVAKELAWRKVKGYIEAHYKDGVDYAQQEDTTERLRKFLVTVLIHGLENDPRANEINKVLEANGISLVDIFNGSIQVCFRCSSRGSLAKLKQLHDEKALDRLFTNAFCPEFSSEGLVSLSIVIPDEQFSKCATSFKRCSMMTRHHRQILLEAVDTLADTVIVTDEFLEKLSLTIQRKQAVMVAEGNRERVKRLMDIMSRLPDTAFARLVDILREDHHDDVAYLIVSQDLTGDDDNMFWTALIGAQNAEQTADVLASHKDTKDEATLNRTRGEICSINSLPLELLEVILIRSFIKLFAEQDKTRKASHQAYSSLAAVCYNWWKTMNGWPQSDTRHWFRNKLRRCVTGEHRQLLITKRGELRQFVDPKGGLLEELVSVGVLHNRDFLSVRSKVSNDEMTLELIDVLLNKRPSTILDRAFEKFLGALKSTGQQHVVYILTGEGEPPLSPLRRSILLKARYKLVSTVDTQHSSLIAQLVSKGVLNEADVQRIEIHDTCERRNSTLLDLIARKSHSAYDRFLQALKDSGHSQVALALEGLELRGLITPPGDGDAAARNKMIRIVRSNMQGLLSGEEREINEITKLMERNGFAISDVAEG